MEEPCETEEGGNIICSSNLTFSNRQNYTTSNSYVNALHNLSSFGEKRLCSDTELRERKGKSQGLSLLAVRRTEHFKLLWVATEEKGREQMK